jgi:hypothetical protein
MAVTINGSGQVPVQVIKNGTTGSLSSTSTSFVDVTNFTVTITPTSASNRILIMTSSELGYTLVTATNVNAQQQLLRGATVISGPIDVTAESASGGLQAQGCISFLVLDSPATTSATTYKVQQRVTSASSTGVTSIGHIVVMEISG